MSVNVNVPDDGVREAAARITDALKKGTAGTDGIVDTFVESYRALPPELSAVDLVSALESGMVHQLESIMIQHFLEQPRPRSGKETPRAISEVRSASRAWGLSPLVLLVEFADAPISDNFWRLLSRLARTGGDWLTMRERLHAMRHHRRHNPLARRQGLSQSQPWAIPDIEAVLQEQKQVSPEEESTHSGDVHGRNVASVSKAHARSLRRKYIRLARVNTPDDDELRDDIPIVGQEPRRERTSKSSPLKSKSRSRTSSVVHDVSSTKGTKRQRLSHGRGIAPPDAERRTSLNVDTTLQHDIDDSDGGSSVEHANQSSSVYPQQADTQKSSEFNPDAFTACRGAQPSVWRFAYGWWLSDDIVHRLITSLVQIQPTFASAEPLAGNSGTAVPLRHQPPATTIVAPLHTKSPSHFALGVISRTEKIISLYDSTARSSSMADAAAAVEHMFARTLPGENFADWTVVARSSPQEQNGDQTGVAATVFALYLLIGRALPFDLDFWVWRRTLACYMSWASLLPDGAQNTEEIEAAAQFSTAHTSLYHEGIVTLDLPPAPPAPTHEGGGATAVANTSTTVTLAAALAQRTACTSHLDKAIGDAQADLAKRRAALRVSTIETRVVWTAAAELAGAAQAAAREELGGKESALRILRGALDLCRRIAAEDGREYAGSTTMLPEEDILATPLSDLERDVRAAEARVSRLTIIRSAISAVTDDINLLLAWLASKGV